MADILLFEICTLRHQECFVNEICTETDRNRQHTNKCQAPRTISGMVNHHG